MKKTLAVFALGLLALSIAGCGGAAAEEPSGDLAPQPRYEYEEEAAEEEAPAEEEEMAEEEEAEFAYPEPLEEEAPAFEPSPGYWPPEDDDLYRDPYRTPPGAMFFEDYGVSPFYPAEVDSLSTFAVDVDTGSYTITRNYLHDNFLPPPEAVRVEEFINYFEQDYPAPQEEAFGLYMDAAPTPFTGPTRYVMRVGVQGYEVPRQQRPDATLVFVIDVSGSMAEDNRLGAVKSALHALTDQLRPSDQVGIVIYGSRGQVWLEPTRASQSRRIHRAIDRLNPGGSTNAEEGLALGYQMAWQEFQPDRITRVVLLSDGVANAGATGPDGILETVRYYAVEGVTLTTVGFGMGNYNDVLMEQLADDGDGNYYYVDTQREAERIFVDELTGTLLTIARDAKIQVEFNPNTVAHYRLIGYENRDVADQDFRNDSVDAGEIGAGHSVTALYEIVPRPGAQGAVAIARLRWEDPETGEVVEIGRTFLTEEVARSFEEAPTRFRQDVAVAAFGETLAERGWYSHTNLDQVWRVSADVSDTIPNDTEFREFLYLVETAAYLQPY